MTTKDGKLLVIGCFPRPPAGASGPQFDTPVELVNIHDFDEIEQSKRANEVDAVIAADHVVSLVPDLHQFPNIRAIISVSVGYGNFSPELVPDGCLFVNTYEHEQPIADWAIMAMLMLSRSVMKFDKAFRDKTLQGLPEYGGMRMDMGDATVGVIGHGHIGQRVIEMCRKFEMRCLVAMRTPISDVDAANAGIEKIYPITELRQMLAECDFVLPTIPATMETTGMFGESEFNATKDTSFLINVARAELLDEKATYAALREGKIAGAAFDVWWAEDDLGLSSDDPERRRWSEYPFWELENVIMSPHWSSYTTAMLRGKFVAVTKQADRLNRGESLINIIPELSNGVATMK